MSGLDVGFLTPDGTLWSPLLSLLHPEVFPSRFGFLGLCCVFPWPRERCPMPVIYILA